MTVCWHRSFIKNAWSTTIRRKCYWQYFYLNAVCGRSFIFALPCQGDGSWRSQIILWFRLWKERIVFEFSKTVIVVDRWIDWLKVCSSVSQNVFVPDFTTVTKKHIDLLSKCFAITFIITIFQTCYLFVFQFIQIAVDCTGFFTRVCQYFCYNIIFIRLKLDLYHTNETIDGFFKIFKIFTT